MGIFHLAQQLLPKQSMELITHGREQILQPNRL